MSATTDTTPVTGAVLVRIPATTTAWIDRLPPVPEGSRVTVSVSRPSLLDVPAASVRSRGYRLVGIHAPSDTDTGQIDLLVTWALIESAPAWWREVLALAERAFDVRLGPVQRILGAEIALHTAR
jgi:hypothetical protein